MLKIVISEKHGGFGLSPEAIIYLLEKKSDLVLGETFKEAKFDPAVEDVEHMEKTSRPGFYSNWLGVVYDAENEMIYDTRCKLATAYDLGYRTHPDLIEVLETLGEAANGAYAHLKVVTITDPDIRLGDLEIHDFAGRESIHEKHRVWE